MAETSGPEIVGNHGRLLSVVAEHHAAEDRSIVAIE
jgi:hypothetical protein